MQMGKRQEEEFRKEYYKCMEEICNGLLEYRERIIEVMKDTDLKTFKNLKAFRDMAKEAVYREVQCIYEKEAAIQEANRIISEPDDD